MFEHEYYKYHRGETGKRSLAIGGYESAFFADLTASYLFEKMAPLFKDALYQGIYRKNGIAVFRREWEVKRVKE